MKKALLAASAVAALLASGAAFAADDHADHGKAEEKKVCVKSESGEFKLVPAAEAEAQKLHVVGDDAEQADKDACAKLTEGEEHGKDGAAHEEHGKDAAAHEEHGKDEAAHEEHKKEEHKKEEHKKEEHKEGAHH